MLPLSANDIDALSAWMDQQEIGAGPIHEVRRLTGGTQNILLHFRRGENEYVMRRPPLNPRPESNKTMLREGDILKALAAAAVPHPRLVGVCADEAVLGMTFLLMEHVEGFNPTVGFPQAVAPDTSLRRRMGFALIDGLAALANVDHDRIGLGDFGRLEGFLERQVARWRNELERYSKFRGWEGAGALGDMEAVAAWLEAFRPKTMQGGVIHGDYHIGNGIFSEQGALLAIVDWEMATLGDPLVDLARLLLSWPRPDGPKPFTMRVDRLDEFPGRGALLQRYAERTARRLDDLPWFEVLACYKMAIIFEGTHARSQAGLAEPETGRRLHASAVALMEEARRIVGLN